MARWPRHVWTSIFTYATVFVLFPLLCLLAYAWVTGLDFLARSMERHGAWS